jgi:hypothetical protein
VLGEVESMEELGWGRGRGASGQGTCAGRYRSLKALAWVLANPLGILSD